VNKVLKMDFKGQTAVLSAVFVLVGMVFLVPAITEKALAVIKASATGTCGPEGDTHPCEFAIYNQHLYSGQWAMWPRVEGTSVTWQTSGNPAPGDEKGWVSVNVGANPKVATSVRLDFDNPNRIGGNNCDVAPRDAGTCHAGSGYTATFTYTLRLNNP
jgi:hypothetical protein